MVGDTSLYKKMEQAEQDIKRDIVFAASLVRTCSRKVKLTDSNSFVYPSIFNFY